MAMNDTRWVICTRCGDPAVEIEADAGADSLEGHRVPLPECDCGPGELDVRDDDGRCWLVFVPDSSGSI